MTSTSAQQTFRWIPGDYNLIGDTRWKDQNRRTRPFRFENPKIQSHATVALGGIIRMLSLSRTSRPWRGVTRQNHHHHHPSHFSRFFLHFFSIVGVRFLFDENQSKTFLLCKTLANGDNAFVQHAPRPQSLIISVLLGYSACQTASESIISLANKIPSPLSTAADSRGPWRRLEKNQLDWHRLIAHSGLKIGKTRQTVNQIHSISAGIKSGCFTSK